MILSGNGRELTVPGKNLKVTASLQLARKDLSGDTSGSEFESAGNKPKKISISGQLEKRNAAELTKLTETAEALDKLGDPIVYTISDDLAEAMNIRQVIFAGALRVAEADNQVVWNFSFELQEYRSVAEAKEARNKDNEVTAVNVDGSTTTVAGKSQHEKILNATEEAVG